MELTEAHTMLHNAIEWEGLDYAIMHYSSWKIFKDIDPYLYGLIKKYQDTSNELASYLDAIGVYDDGI